MRKIKTFKGLAMPSPIPRFSILTLFLFSFLLQQNIQAQAPITTQAEIDNLVANCACTTLPGDLIIIGVGDITDLTPLAPLTAVDGILTISFFPNPISLDGLNNITSVGGNFVISSTSQLTDLSDLASLSSVGGNVNINSNTALENLNGLNALTTIGGSLSIDNNTALTNLDGLESLSSIGGSASNGLGLQITGNSLLADCCGIQDLIANPSGITGDVIINNNQTGCDSETDMAESCVTDPDNDEDGVTVGQGDCDDNDPNNFPGNTELCDGLDNNCDNQIDEGFDLDSDLIADCFDPCPLAPTTLSNFNEANCNCNPGYFPITEDIGGQLLITACQPCPAGSYCPDGINQLLCPAGAFSTELAQAECALCPSGQFQPETGATECYDCCEDTSSPQGATSCDPGPWSGFSECSTECGEGTTSRTRAITLFDAGLVICDLETETETCTNIDTESPVFENENGPTCPSSLTFLCSDQIPPINPALEVMDNCDSAPTVELTIDETVNGPNNQIIVCTYLATDDSGNTSTCLQTITVNDDEAPVSVCQNVTVDLDADGNASITALDIDDGCSDGCSFTLDLSQSDFTCDNLGSNMVTLTATDPSGNSSSCTSEVTVNDVLESCNSGEAPLYCESYGESTAYEWIESVAINSADYTSGDDSGYGDYTGTVVPLATGWNSLQLTPGFAGNNYREYWTVFIDFNQDGVFDVATETAYFGSSFYEINANIDVPSDAPTGTTRMRIAMRYGQYAYPCDVFAEGEVEDYTVEISFCDNVTDAGEIGDNESLCEADNDPAEILSLADANGGSGTIEYLWLMNTSTPTPPTAYNMNGWVEIPNSNSPSYDPGPISETTWYLRCARQSGCIQYSGESNVVEKAYEAVCPLEYCDSEGGNTSYEWIKKVVIGSISNYSGNDNGYGDYTNLSTNMNCGQSKNIKLKPGYSGNAYKEYWRVWVDWNQDGDFDDAGELEVQTSGYYTRYGTVSAPSDATHGDTRMRVSMSYDAYPSPCEAFDFGEVEDYTIHVNANGFAAGGGQDDGGKNKSGATVYNDEDNENESTQTIENALVNVYPNPATTHVFVNLSSFAGQAIDLQITNTLGQVMLRQQIVEVLDQQLSFDLSTFETGHYVVTVTTADGNRIAKGLVVRK